MNPTVYYGWFMLSCCYVVRESASSFRVLSTNNSSATARSAAWKCRQRTSPLIWVLPSGLRLEHPPAWRRKHSHSTTASPKSAALGFWVVPRRRSRDCCLHHGRRPGRYMRSGNRRRRRNCPAHRGRCARNDGTLPRSWRQRNRVVPAPEAVAFVYFRYFGMVLGRDNSASGNAERNSSAQDSRAR